MSIYLDIVTFGERDKRRKATSYKNSWKNKTLYEKQGNHYYCANFSNLLPGSNKETSMHIWQLEFKEKMWWRYSQALPSCKVQV